MKNFLKSTILVLLFTCLTMHSQAQQLQLDVQNEEVFIFRVKQISEFIDRFNYNFDSEFKDALNDKNITLSRTKAIHSLINHSDPRLNSDSTSYSKQYYELVSEFSNHCVKNEVVIEKSSENIYAIASTNGLYKNNPVVFNIILKQEKVGKDMLKWVLFDVDAGFIDVFKDDTTLLRFLPPSSDELDFMELRRAMNDTDFLDQYAHKGFTYSPLSVFIFLINRGELTTESVSKVSYKICEIPGWEIHVKEYNRNKQNSGWLISNIIKTESQ